MDLVRFNDFTLIEIHYELASQRLNCRTLMAKHNARLAGECPHFHQRVFHAGNLSHGAQRFKNHGRTHALGAEIAQFFDLQEIKERIGFRRRQQTGFFPACQLPSCNAKDPQNV